MHHKDLEVYKKAVDFVVRVYELTKSFPKDEVYGLTSQLRRAAVSIPSNIAEGCARYSEKETKNFVNVAFASLVEVETQLEIALKLGYIKEDSAFDKEFNALKSLLLGFKKHLECTKK